MPSYNKRRNSSEYSSPIFKPETSSTKTQITLSATPPTTVTTPSIIDVDSHDKEDNDSDIFPKAPKKNKSLEPSVDVVRAPVAIKANLGKTSLPPLRNKRSKSREIIQNDSTDEELPPGLTKRPTRIRASSSSRFYGKVSDDDSDFEPSVRSKKNDKSNWRERERVRDSE